MEYYEIVNRIYPDPKADFNPACFNFTEEEARSKKLWIDERPMPTKEHLDAENVIYQAELEAENTDRQNKKDSISVIKIKLENKSASLDEIREVLFYLLGS